MKTKNIQIIEDNPNAAVVSCENKENSTHRRHSKSLQLQGMNKRNLTHRRQSKISMLASCEKQRKS